MTRTTPKPQLISPEDYLVFDDEAVTLSSLGLRLVMENSYAPS